MQIFETGKNSMDKKKKGEYPNNAMLFSYRKIKRLIHVIK